MELVEHRESGLSLQGAEAHLRMAEEICPPPPHGTETDARVLAYWRAEVARLRADQRAMTQGEVEGS